MHLLLFALLAATARLRFGARAGVLAALVAYAVGSEVVQARVLPARSGDAADVGADLAGVALGWALLAADRAVRSTRSGGQPGATGADLQV